MHKARLQGQRDPNRVVDHATSEPPQDAENFSGRWPAGSLSARVEKAIRLLEHGRTDMEKTGVSREQLESTQRSLEQMKRNLDRFIRAKEKVREGIRTIKRIFIRT